MTDDLFPSADQEELVQRKEDREAKCNHKEHRVVNVLTGERGIMCSECGRRRYERRMKMDELTWPPPKEELPVDESNLETEYIAKMPGIE